jgi:UrcA family protein
MNWSKAMKSMTNGWSIGRSIKLATVLAVSAAGFTASDAGARVGDSSEQRTIRVSLKDLDLATPQDQRALRSRIRWAADLVCGGHDFLSLQVMSEYRNCLNDATNGALAQIKFPQS